MRSQLTVLPLLALAVLGLGACSASPGHTGTPADRGGEVATGQGAATPGPETGPVAGDLLQAELTTVGWDELSGSPVVLLRELGSGQVLPIWIGIAEARAISLELHGIELRRPMTHDLMASLLGHLDAELEEVVVHDLREGTYYGLLKVWQAGQDEPRWIDTRPSDGLALALRTDAKIRIARKLIEELPDYRFQPPDTREQVVRALGLTVVAADDEWREELSLPDRPGVVVIAAAGEAGRRGMRRGDLIVEIDGRPTREPVDLLTAIADAPAGEKLSVTYWRNGEESTVELDLAIPERPKAERVA